MSGTKCIVLLKVRDTATAFLLLLLRVSPDPSTDLVDAITHGTVKHLQTERYSLPLLVRKIRNLRSNLIHVKLQGFNLRLHYIKVLTVYG
jgi:hypothetical protein